MPPFASADEAASAPTVAAVLGMASHWTASAEKRGARVKQRYIGIRDNGRGAGAGERFVGVCFQGQACPGHTLTFDQPKNAQTCCSRCGVGEVWVVGAGAVCQRRAVRRF